MKKIPLFTLILAVMLSTGGSCIFPILTAQASSVAMMGMDMMDSENTLNGHEMNSAAHSYAPLSSSHVSTCSSDCGQTDNDAVATKKVKEVLELPSLASQGTYVPLLNEFDHSISEISESPPLRDTLLTVSKKE